MSYRVVPDLFEKHVKGTASEAIVQNVLAFLCNLTVAVLKGTSWSCNRVYINTRVLKHLYDKKPAEEFLFIVENIHSIVKYPDRIYKNRDAKRGDLCFIKQLKNDLYICSIEVIENEEVATHCEVATCFRIRKENYLANYEILLEWKGGTPSSYWFLFCLTSAQS